MAGLNPPTIKLPGLSLHPEGNGNGANNVNGNVGRARSRSVLKVEHVDSSNEETLDQAAYANINAEWVNRKGAQYCNRRRPSCHTIAHHSSSSGAWMIHVVLIATGKVIIDALPGVTPNISWTAVNLTYLAVRGFFHIPCTLA